MPGAVVVPNVGIGLQLDAGSAADLGFWVLGFGIGRSTWYFFLSLHPCLVQGDATL